MKEREPQCWNGGRNACYLIYRHNLISYCSSSDFQFIFTYYNGTANPCNKVGRGNKRTRSSCQRGGEKSIVLNEQMRCSRKRVENKNIPNEQMRYSREF